MSARRGESTPGTSPVRQALRAAGAWGEARDDVSLQLKLFDTAWAALTGEGSIWRTIRLRRSPQICSRIRPAWVPDVWTQRPWRGLVLGCSNLVATNNTE